MILRDGVCAISSTVSIVQSIRMGLGQGTVMVFFILWLLVL